MPKALPLRRESPLWHRSTGIGPRELATRTDRVQLKRQKTMAVGNAERGFDYRHNGITREAAAIVSLTRQLLSSMRLTFRQAEKEAGAYGLMHYLKGALAGGLCCALTHGAMCPFDVVKTRIQLEADKFTSGVINAFGQIVKNEGMGALTTGLGATVIGYFVQGWFKFGGVEFFKINFARSLGERRAWKNRIPIYLGAAACAEFIADIFLCPLEATRIRLVSNPEYASGLLTAMPKILAEEGLINGFYSGFAPILLKQIPYTMAKFAVQGWAAEKIYRMFRMDSQKASKSKQLGVSLAAGVLAGVAAAIISHPADTLLSLINKDGAGGTGPILTRLFNLAKETGFVNLCLTGLAARCVMISFLTAAQFGLFDAFMALTGAQKFKFKNPDEKNSDESSKSPKPQPQS